MLDKRNRAEDFNLKKEIAPNFPRPFAHLHFRTAGGKHGRLRWDQGKERTTNVHPKQGLILGLPYREKGTMALPSRLMGSSRGTHMCVPQRVTVKVVCMVGKEAQVTCV